MRRLRFFVDITTNDHADADSYSRLASIVEDAIRNMQSRDGFDRMGHTFYLGNVRVLKKPPRK